MDSPRPAVDRQWYIAQRWQEFEGEGGANLLRVIAVGSFYIIHLVNHLQAAPLAGAAAAAAAESQQRFHLAVTALAVAWTMVAVAVMGCL